jgi:hypothetical protein
VESGFPTLISLTSFAKTVCGRYAQQVFQRNVPRRLFSKQDTKVHKCPWLVLKFPCQNRKEEETERASRRRSKKPCQSSNEREEAEELGKADRKSWYPIFDSVIHWEVMANALRIENSESNPLLLENTVEDFQDEVEEEGEDVEDTKQNTTTEEGPGQ